MRATAHAAGLRKWIRRTRVSVATHGCRVRRAPLQVVIGSAGTTLAGWIATDVDTLDITQPRDWRCLFRPGSIDRLLAEHVLEHLSVDDCQIALREAHRYLKPGATFRIAVPDGNRRDEAYARAVTPPADGHRTLFISETLIPLLEGSGFRVTPLEYFDAQGIFHAHGWDPEEGMVMRSVRFDRQAAFRLGELFYTSLIVDAHKV